MTGVAARLVCAWLLLLAVGYGAGRLVTETQPRWDATLLSDLRGADHGTLTDAMRFITGLGGTLVLDVVFIVVMAVLLVRRYWRDALFLLLASPGTVVLVQVLKAAVNRPRPADHHLVAAQNASWPSGHASSSTALYGAILVIVLSRQARDGERPRLARSAAICLTAILVALIGYSRVYLGVHYPTDVLAGWVVVAAWIFVLARCLRLRAFAGRRERQSLQPPSDSGRTLALGLQKFKNVVVGSPDPPGAHSGEVPPPTVERKAATRG